MKADDPEVLIARGFIFGLHAFAHAHGLDFPPDGLTKTLAFVWEIAAGQSTMIMSAAEWVSGAPEMPDSMKAKTPEFTHLMMKGERETAQAVLSVVSPTGR